MGLMETNNEKKETPKSIIFLLGMMAGAFVMTVLLK